MTRIHQQVSGRQHELWYELSIRCEQRSKARDLGVRCVGAVWLDWRRRNPPAQLNGSVTDPSGAAVAGAKITLTEPATGSQRTATSNASGLYQFLDVPPGEYRLEAAATGFAPFVAPKVTLVVKSALHRKHSAPGCGRERPSVTSKAKRRSSIARTRRSGNVLENAQISELPIADRNVAYLLSLQPGVAFLGTQSNQDTDTRSGAVNGVRSDQSNVTLDGIGVNDQNNGYAFTSVLNAPPDSVEEFRVTTANSNADTGYSSGGQVALVTKSGTNNFHGSAYEYNRNTIFSANDPFLKNSQLTSGQSNTAPKLLRNVFGVTVGGPIMKDRLFFFANYEGPARRRGQQHLADGPQRDAARGRSPVLMCDALRIVLRATP